MMLLSKRCSIMADKKGQGISMNMIIIAALALLVLVTISLIFISRTGVFSQQAKSCESAGGQCVDQADWPTCQVAAEQAGYDTGRRRTDLRCFDSRGRVRSNEICCVFV